VKADKPDSQNLERRSGSLSLLIVLSDDSLKYSYAELSLSANNWEVGAGFSGKTKRSISPMANSKPNVDLGHLSRPKLQYSLQYSVMKLCSEDIPCLPSLERSKLLGQRTLDPVTLTLCRRLGKFVLPNQYWTVCGFSEWLTGETTLLLSYLLGWSSCRLRLLSQNIRLKDFIGL
jgi:hypothetical protein